MRLRRQVTKLSSSPARTPARSRASPRSFRKKNQVIVEGVNTAKKHQRPRGQTMQGGVIDKDMPIDASNVMIFCDDCGKPTRIGYRFDDNGKHRVCQRCGSDL